MISLISKEAAGIVRRQKNRRHYACVFACLAVAVALGTMLALRLYGVAMTNRVRVFACDVQPHTHTEACYVELDGAEILNCGEAELLLHTHTLDCYDDDGTLVCKLPELEEHTHDADCRQVTSTLVCDLEESPAHSHSDTCLTEVRELACTLTECEPHTHGEGCYTTESALTCGEPAHTHSDVCYSQPGELACGMTEHAHGDACYTGVQALTCPLPEAGHTHTDACYTLRTDIACGLAETEGHTHTDACYNEETTYTCGKPEVIAHVHTDACYTPAADLEVMSAEELLALGLVRDALKTVELPDTNGEPCTMALTCGMLQVPEHTHTEADGCFYFEQSADEAAPQPTPVPTAQPEPVLACGLEEHAHTEACRTWHKLLICGLEEDRTHTHTDACYYTEKALGCGLEEHTHTAACYIIPTPDPGAPVEGSCCNACGDLVCGLEEHTHSNACFTMLPAAVCGIEEGEAHTHTDACFDEQPVLTCGLAEHTHIWPAGMEPPAQDEAFTAECELDGLLVTATWYAAANIPPQAEFRAERIAPDGEQAEHYARRVAEAAAAMAAAAEADADADTSATEPATAETAAKDAEADAGAGIEEADAEESDVGPDVGTADTDDADAETDSAPTIKPLALLNIGFFMPDGAEVAPESSVSITVRFLDDDGAVAGSGVTVVHFANTPDILPGQSIEDDCAVSFETASFSDFLLASIPGSSGAAEDDGDRTGGDGIAMIAEDNDLKLDISKRIDYLGNNGSYGDEPGNDDTSADNGSTKITDDLYRLYLDIDGSCPGVDLLFVIDRSASMVNGEGLAVTDMNRSDRQVYELLYGKENFIEQFLQKNTKNKAAAVWYGGQFKWDNPKTTTTDESIWEKSPIENDEGGVIHEWVSYNQWPALKATINFNNSVRSQAMDNTKASNGNDSKSVGVDLQWGITNYVAGYFRADMMLNKSGVQTDGNKKVVIFLSDGLPTVYYPNFTTNEQWNDILNRKASNTVITRRGDGAESSVTTSSDYIKKNEAVFDLFVKRHQDIVFYSVGYKMSDKNANKVQRTIVLDYMVKKYTSGGSLLSAEDKDALKANLNAISLRSNKVTITDQLSKFVELYAQNPGVKVTARPVSNSTSNNTTELWVSGSDPLKPGTPVGQTTEKSVKGVTAADIVQGVTYDSASRTVTLTFKPDYYLDPDLVYTLSFNVQLTNAAYNYFAKYYDSAAKKYAVPAGMGAPVTEGEPGTNYTANTGSAVNKTSANKSGLPSNKSAEASLTFGKNDVTQAYRHPVVQAWGTYFRVQKVKEDGSALTGASFRLQKGDGTIMAAAGGGTTDGDSYTLTGANGTLQWGMLPTGKYTLSEKAPKGYKYTGEEKDIAVFWVEKGRITNMQIKNGVKASWSGPQNPLGTNNTPNTCYGAADTSLITLTVTNEELPPVVIYKKSSAGEQPLAGAVFQMWKAKKADDDTWTEDGNAQWEKTTGSDGKLFEGILDPGTYILRETAAPQGYRPLSKPVKFKVQSDGTLALTAAQGNTDAQATKGSGKNAEGKPTVTLTLFNKPTPVELRIHKADSGTGKALAGAEFALWLADDSGNLTKPLWQGTSGADGLLVRSSGDDPYPQIEGGKKYILKEMKAPDGYQILREKIRIEVGAADDGTVTVYYYLGEEKKEAACKTAEDGTVYYTFTVLNTSGEELPATGGAGTGPYTMGGLLLMAFALVYIALQGRRARKT